VVRVYILGVVCVVCVFLLAKFVCFVSVCVC